MARTGVEKVGQQLPRAPAARPLASRIPWTVWIVLALGLYAYWRHLTQRSKRSKQPRRRIATKAEPRRPSALHSFRELGSTPKLSRRSSFARGVRGPTSKSYAGSQTTSRAGSPFRPSFSSGRLAHLAQIGAGTPASSTGGPSRHANSFGPDMSEVSFQRSSNLPHSPSNPLLGQRHHLANRSNGLLRSASSYLIDSREARDASPRPRRSVRSAFTDNYPPPVLDSASRKRRDFDTESSGTISQRSGKRFRMTDDERGAFDEDEQDSDDAAMELDEMVEVAAAQQKRGIKRGPMPQGGPVKRTRQGESAEDTLSNEGDEMDTEPDSEFLTKKRSRPSRDPNESFAEESVEDKRPRKDIHSKGSSKRHLDLVDTPTEEDEFDFEGEEADDDRSLRNADSEVDDDEEQEQDDESQEQRRPHRSKRARSMEERTESGEDSLMGDDDYEAEAAADVHLASSNVASGSSRNRGDNPKAPAAYSTSTKVGASKTVRRPGDTWINLEGDRCRMDADGKQRKLCEVREMRRKYKMPKDSIHPDAKIMHEVVTEKWLTQEEYTQLLARGKLAWQAAEDTTASKAGAQSTSDSSAASQNKKFQTKPKEIYFATGTRTPLRTHSVLSSRPSSGSASPVLTPQSPAYATLLNGRMRLPSGAHPSPARSWSTSKSARLIEDEQKAKAERERRRRASIMLGGEEEIKEVPQKAPTPPTPSAAVAALPSTLSTPPTQPAAKVDPETKDHKSKPLFGFGKAPTTSEPPASSGASPSFFSKPAAASEPPKTDESPKPTDQPSFFANVTNVTKPQSNATAPSSESVKASPFSFGAPSSNSALPAQSTPSTNTTKAPSFFGAPPTSSSAPSANASAPFPAPPASSSLASTPFSLGSATSSGATNPSPLSSHTPSTASPAAFSFGASSNNMTPGTGKPFLFGQSQNSFGTAIGASTPTQSPGAAPAVFNFGSGGDQSTGSSAPRRRIAGRRPAGAR
ncbi:BQ2448_4130 [Microbotryum intermedium]|uniref:BQ2448_4130 protein n=1 Tax=Microbotryum intermedium TaxID=269621 RepID=A0A238FKR7_9BASI|nr:BQ2448_4130 [Microbotryum intermedium]